MGVRCYVARATDPLLFNRSRHVLFPGFLRSALQIQIALHVLHRPTREPDPIPIKLAVMSALYMPALSAMRFNPAVAALVARLKTAGRLKPKQIVVAAMRKLLVLCFGVLKTGKRFEPAIAMPA
jgi:hypothetical protein